MKRLNDFIKEILNIFKNNNSCMHVNRMIGVGAYILLSIYLYSSHHNKCAISPYPPITVYDVYLPNLNYSLTNSVQHTSTDIIAIISLLSAEEVKSVFTWDFLLKLIFLKCSITVLCMLFRTINYVDTARKYNLKIRWLFFWSWWNAIWGYYNVVFEDNIWDGAVFKTNFILSDISSHWEVTRTYPFTVGKNSDNNYRWYALSVYPQILGLIELLFFTLFLKSNHLDYIAWFIGILTAAQWNTWKEDRAVFYTFIIGTLLNIIGSYVLAVLWI